MQKIKWSNVIFSVESSRLKIKKMTKKRRQKSNKWQKKSLSKLKEPLQQKRTLLCLHILFTNSVLQLTTSGAGYGNDMPSHYQKN